MAENRNLNPSTFLQGISRIGAQPVRCVMGGAYDQLWPKMERIRLVRNKLVHGQITGQGIRSPQLEQHVQTIVDWIGRLAEAAQEAYGYDGLKRNTFKTAKSTQVNSVAAYPFDDASTFKSWLETIG